MIKSPSMVIRPGELPGAILLPFCAFTEGAATFPLPVTLPPSRIFTCSALVSLFLFKFNKPFNMSIFLTAELTINFTWLAGVGLSTSMIAPPTELKS